MGFLRRIPLSALRPLLPYGIAGFVKDPDDTGGKLGVQYTSSDRRVKAWWNLLSERGMVEPARPLAPVAASPSHTPTAAALPKTWAGTSS